jgi:demethylmenaquinone methyltransferase / 2-methoxy-6-polyprenyl-1,4-benzoquinol methylase
MKQKPLEAIFAEIPRHYDVINHIMTLGLDVRWRNALARKCLESNPSKVLDLCCGTGDLALTVARFAKIHVEIFGLDFSKNMLEIAVTKATKAHQERIHFTFGDASDMPFGNETFDSVGISFGFRNLTFANPLASKFLSEILRVLGKAGRFVIAETSQPSSGFIRFFYHLYLKAFVLPVGILISGNKSAYKYLIESSRRYYDRGQLTDLLLKAGFSKVVYKPMMLGATSLVVAQK